MYNLIIGNTRVTVHDDAISRQAATAAATAAIAAAGRSGRMLSRVEISAGPEGPVVKTVERAAPAARKTVRQSMVDSVKAAVAARLVPPGPGSRQDIWIDEETGQEWRGEECRAARAELLARWTEWIKTL